MKLDACPTAIGPESFLNMPSTCSNLFTIKVFDINGKFAKTIKTESLSTLNEIRNYMLDLANGTYILNAFSQGHFVKAFKLQIN